MLRHSAHVGGMHPVSERRIGGQRTHSPDSGATRGRRSVYVAHPARARVSAMRMERPAHGHQKSRAFHNRRFESVLIIGHMSRCHWALPSVP